MTTKSAAHMHRTVNATSNFYNTKLHEQQRLVKNRCAAKTRHINRPSQQFVGKMLV